MRYPEIDTYDANYDFHTEREIPILLRRYGLIAQEPVHLISSTTAFLRRFTPLYYLGTYYSRILHKSNIRSLMAQMTVVAYKKS
jgi:hypothetical protein